MMAQPGRSFAFLSEVGFGYDMTKYFRPQTAYAIKHCSMFLLFSRAKRKNCSYYFNAFLTLLYQPGICVSETGAADCICHTFARTRNGHGLQGITRYSTRPTFDPSVHAFEFSLFALGNQGLQEEIKLVPMDMADKPGWYKKVYPKNQVCLVLHGKTKKSSRSYPAT